MILILSNKWDLTVDLVVRELRERGLAYARLNTEDLPQGSASIALPEFKIEVARGRDTIRIDEAVTVVWNRRPGRPFDDIPTDHQPPRSVRRFVNDQWMSWLESTQLVEGARWINPPEQNSAMESKIRQLRRASCSGFRIPPTLVTNDPLAVEEFYRNHDGKVVAKALYSPLIEEEDHDLFIFSNALSEEDLDDRDEMSASPSIFQKALLPKVDYRVTVVGNRVFAARIEKAGNAAIPLDWRKDEGRLTFSECSLPDHLELLCRKYVRDCGLLFGAIDLVEHRGEYYFLEINPNGEWGWLDKSHGFPISTALCDLMQVLGEEKQQ